jgi:hypothetical protein
MIGSRVCLRGLSLGLRRGVHRVVAEFGGQPSVNAEECSTCALNCGELASQLPSSID